MKHYVNAHERAEKAEAERDEARALVTCLGRAIRGEPVSDFGQSFGIVREAMDLRSYVDEARGDLWVSATASARERREGEPLNVRTARALGCKVTACGGPGTHRSKRFRCGCARLQHAVEEDVWLSPYGEESPAGWACTGPLIARFGLCTQTHLDEYLAYRWTGRASRVAPTPCAAVAEWVAQYVEGGEVKP